MEGDTDEEVLDFVVARYGEFVLLKPRLSARNMLLWGTPLIGLALGLTAIFFLFRMRRGAAPASGLTAEEKEKLSRIMSETEDGSR